MAVNQGSKGKMAAGRKMVQEDYFLLPGRSTWKDANFPEITGGEGRNRTADTGIFSFTFI
jgi:hypothetical protein